VLLLVVRRLIQIVLTLVGLSALLFAMLAALPGDPVELLIASDPSVRPEDVTRLRRLRGLDQPWTVQYWRWLYGYERPRHPPAPPPLSTTVLMLDEAGKASARLALGSGESSESAGPLTLEPLFGARQEHRDVVVEVEGAGEHAVWLKVQDQSGLESLARGVVLAAPFEVPPEPATPDEEAQLAGGTEEPSTSNEVDVEARLVEAARASAPRLVMPVLDVVIAADDGSVDVDLRELLAEEIGEVRARGLALEVVAGPGIIEDGRYRHRFEEPGQTVVGYVARSDSGAAAHGAFVVDHGPLGDPDAFVHGALFAFLGEREALGYSSMYRRPVWDLLFGVSPICGDGARQPGETCDDGNVIDGDGCSSGCVDETLGLFARADAFGVGVLQNAGRLFNTLFLMLPALLLSILIGVGVGVFAAARATSRWDRVLSGLAFVGNSTPAFWLGIMALFLFAEHLRWLPAGGVQTPGLEGGFFPLLVDRVTHALLPVGVLALVYAGRWMRHTRAAMLEVLPNDFVRTARAMGFPERTVLWRHAFRNALLPLVTLLALSLPALVSGAVLTEHVFSWPGLGRLELEAVLNRDSYLAIVVFLTAALFVMLGSLCADVLYGLVDPRIRRR